MHAPHHIPTIALSASTSSPLSHALLYHILHITAHVSSAGFSLQLKIALSHVHMLYNRYRVRLDVYLLYWLASSTLNLARLSCMYCGQSLVCDSFMLCLISDHETCNRVSFMLCVPWQEAISNCIVLVRDQ